MKSAHAPRTGAAALELLEARLLFFGLAIHQDITASALSFLNSSVLATINDQHRVQDKVDPNGDTAAYHFDGCYFNEGATTINARYQTIQGNSNPAGFNSAVVAREFGKIMHAVQDLYAHSNWVEDGLKSLVEPGLGLWNPLAPYTLHDGAMIIEGESQHPSVSPYGTATFSRSGHVVKVSFPGGKTFPGIISGAWEQEKIPDNIEVHHDDLNKDYPDRPWFQPAHDLALSQSKHEFSRLGALIQSRWGSAGVNKLLATWVKPDQASQDKARALLHFPSTLPTSTFIATGQSWKYLDNGSNQGTSWNKLSFSDSAWKSGKAQLGYGDGDEASVVSFGPNPGSKFITTYFRKAFTVADPSAVSNLSLKLLRDDGAVVYLNGTEVYRSNMPSGTIAYTTLASHAVEDKNFYSAAVNRGLLVAGKNVIAVEIHQCDKTSSDISFDLSLTGSVKSAAAAPGTLSSTPSSLTTKTSSTTTATKVINLITDPTKPLV